MAEGTGPSASYYNQLKPIDFVGHFPVGQFNVSFAKIFDINHADEYLRRLEAGIEFDSPELSTIRAYDGRFVYIPRLQVILFYSN